MKNNHSNASPTSTAPSWGILKIKISKIAVIPETEIKTIFKKYSNFLQLIISLEDLRVYHRRALNFGRIYFSFSWSFSKKNTKQSFVSMGRAFSTSSRKFKSLWQYWNISACFERGRRDCVLFQDTWPKLFFS